MHTEPVFVDASGRRRCIIRRSSLAAGVALTVFLATLVIGVATGSGVPLTPWSDPGKNLLNAGVAPSGDHPKLYAKGGSQPSTPHGRVATHGRSTPTAHVTGPRPSTTQPTTRPTAVPTGSPTKWHSPPGEGKHTKSPSS